MPWLSRRPLSRHSHSQSRISKRRNFERTATGLVAGQTHRSPDGTAFQVRSLLANVIGSRPSNRSVPCHGDDSDREGLERYRDRPADLVITDIVMPELNGL